MDGQRQYPAEPERWYGEHPDDEPGRVPGQRPGDTGRGGEPVHYGEPDRYPEEPGRYAFDDSPQYPDPGYAPEPAYPEQHYAEPAYEGAAGAAVYQSGSDAPPRRSPVRRRVGKRSGLDMPALDTTAESRLPEPEPAEEPQRYRAERLDRQALRRPDAVQPDMRDIGAPQPPQAAPAGPPQAPSYQPLQSPTQALPAPPPAVYLSKRPGLATLLGTVAVIVELFLARVLLTAEFSHIVISNGVLCSVFAMAGTPLVAIGLYALAIGAAGAAGPNPARAWLRTPLAYLPVGLILIFAAAIAA